MLLRWLFEVLIILHLTFIIVGNFVRLYYWLRCGRKHDEFFNPCHSKECWYREFCPKWSQPMTVEDIVKLQKMIEDMKQNPEL